MLFYSYRNAVAGIKDSGTGTQVSLPPQGMAVVYTNVPESLPLRVGAERIEMYGNVVMQEFHHIVSIHPRCYIKANGAKMGGGSCCCAMIS